jgi:hypothetical protein
MCIITCVVAVQGPIPISPHFNINGTAYTVAGIENGSLPGVAVTHNTTHYALVFTCAPMQYQCDLSGEQSSDIISVEPDVGKCISATSTINGPSTEHTSNGPLRTATLHPTSLLPSVSPTLFDNRTTNGTVPYSVPFYMWLIGASGCIVIILCIIGVVAFVLKTAFFFVSCGHSPSMNPIQAQDSGPSKVVLSNISYPLTEIKVQSPLPAVYHDVISDTDSVSSRPEQRVSSPEPEELALPGGIRLLTESTDT